MEELRSWWQSHYGANPPLGHILKQKIRKRWFRIHSLPQFKRYPETPDEYAITLERQIAVANEVLGVGSQCFLLVGRYAESAKVYEESQNLPML